MSAGLGGIGGLSQNAETSDALEGGWGGLIQNTDMITLWMEGVGELKKTNIVVQYLKLTLH